MAECLILGSGDKSFDANASASDLLSGKTAYVNGVKITGNQPNRGAVSKTLNAGESYDINEGFYGNGKITAKDLASQTPGNLDASKMLSGQYGYSNGIKATGTMADRGQYQYATSLGEGVENGVNYWSLNGAPEGYYHKINNDDWAPELRYPKEDLRKRLNIFPDTVRKGYIVGDITGTWYGNKAVIAAFAARGFGASTSDYETYNEASFTMPASGMVYYGGANCGYYVSSSKCQILKNGSVVDNRDFDGSNWRNGFRGTMINKSFSANAGDVIKVICAQESGTHGMSCIQAVIVY